MKKLIFLISLLFSVPFVNAQVIINDTMHIWRGSLTWSIDSTDLFGPSDSLYSSDQVFFHERTFFYPGETISDVYMNNTPYDYILAYNYFSPSIAIETFNKSKLTFNLNNRYWTADSFTYSAHYIDTNAIDTIYISYTVLVKNPQPYTYTLRVNLTVIIDPIITSIESHIITSSIEVYPNPFIDNINLKINALESSKTSVLVTDVLGKVYENKEVELNIGENVINLPIDCPKGLYLISLVVNNKTITYKIVK